MKKTLQNTLLALLLLPLAATGQAGVDTLSLEDIFYEPLLAGHRPSLADFSPDGRWVYYTANDSAMSANELFRVRLDGSERQKAPDRYERGYALSPDGSTLLYGNRGDIWLADTDFRNKRRLVESAEAEYNATWSPDSRRVAYVQGGNIWIMDVDNSKLTQVTNKSSDDPGYSIASWAGNDKIVLSQYDTSDYREYYFPEYVGHYVVPGSTRRGVATQILSVAYTDSNRVKEIARMKGYLSSSAGGGGRYLAVDLIDSTMKERKITVFDLREQSSEVVFEDSTDGWLHGTEIAFAPEGDRLMIRSERDGWNHIYSVLPDGSGFRQHTEGPWEVTWAEWTGPQSMVYASSEADPGERHLYALNTEDDSARRLTQKEGFRQAFELSRDKRHVVYEYSYFNEPFELYALDLRRPGRETRLTQTIPERFRAIDWQREDYLRFTGRDGETEISMSVLEPHDMQPGERYPVAVFVHGAGSLQNVYKGWSNNYYREYMFHQMLNARGYYVMEVDYRHSTGYGREFREDVTGWMGKYETHDIVDGLKHLAANYAQADTGRVGIYGGSYGGFMALYATSVAPEHFDAAAALRAVTNWENYYHTNPWYTWPRLGTPKADSTHYARSSPITYVDRLEKPVLILHGLTDNNVGFQDAAQYVEELIQAGGKEFEMMMYPSERHSFQDPDAWYDEYRRIYEFFEEHLREKGGG